MTLYFPAQIVPLKLKLEQLPESYIGVKDPYERLKICREYRISSVSQFGKDVQILIVSDKKENNDIHLRYQFDQCVYIQE